MALILLVGAGAAVGVTKSLTGSAKSAVQDYFKALEDGDATKALTYLRLPADLDLARYPLLTGKALADERNRPGDLRIGTVHQLGKADGADPATDPQTMDLTFRAGASLVHQSVGVAKDNGKYRLQGALAVLTVDGEQSRPLSVNGVAVPGGTQLAAFPGSYTVVAAGNPLFAPSSTTVVPEQDQRNILTAKATFGTPSLADGAQTVIQAKARAKLDACAATTALRTPRCPFWIAVQGYDAVVRWSITSYPGITVRIGARPGTSPTVAFTGDGLGTVVWQLTFTDYSGVPVQKSGTLTFLLGGTAQLTGSAIEVSLNQ